MDFVVDMTLPARIIVGATGLQGLAQEIRTLLSTRKGSVPLDRDFGIDWSLIDMPLTDAMPQAIAEYSRQIERYVPRVRVVSVKFKQAAGAALEGKLFPVVKVAVKEEYLDELR